MDNSAGNKLSKEDQYYVDRIHAGNKQVFDKMFMQYYSGLCNFVWHIIKTEDAYEDLVQDIFVKIWIGRQDWHPHASIKSYLFRSAKNQALNYLRSYDVINIDQEDDIEEEISGDINIEEELYRKDLSKAVQSAIESLPERCRLVFVMHRQEGLKYNEIADILNISINTVEKQMGRAFRILRKLLINFLPTLGVIQYIRHII